MILNSCQSPASHQKLGERQARGSVRSRYLNGWHRCGDLQSAFYTYSWLSWFWSYNCLAFMLNFIWEKVGLCRSKNPLDFPRLCATFILMMLAVDESAKILWVQWMPRLDKFCKIGHISSNIRDIWIRVLLFKSAHFGLSSEPSFSMFRSKFVDNSDNVRIYTRICRVSILFIMQIYVNLLN